MYSEKLYSNKALIPFWVVHLVLILIFIAIYAVDMMEVAGDLGYEPAILSAFMAFFCIAMVLEPLEMVLQSYRLLEPWVYLSFQVYKSLWATIYAIFELYGYVKGNLAGQTGIWKWVAIILIIVGICMAISFYSSLAYAIVILKRHRKRSTFDYGKEQVRDDTDSDSSVYASGGLGGR